MPYTVNEYRIQVRGKITDSEEWNNTWTVLDVVGGQDVQDAGDIFAAFYEDITTFASWLSSSYEVLGAVAINLNTLTRTDLTGFSFVGSAGDPLPTQMAMRVSLGGANGRRGGPFLTGFAKTASQSDSTIVNACVTDFIGALETMCNSLTAGGWQLRLDSPTDDLTVAVLQGRVGDRFDVIRKRANNIPEAYTAFSVS